MRQKLGLTLLGFVPAFFCSPIVGMAGQAIAKRAVLCFSTPGEVFVTFVDRLSSGELIIDFAYTFLPIFLGFIGGVSLGSFIGFLLLSSEKTAAVTEWYVVVLGSIPIFAIAPMMLIWFGIGLLMKVAVAFPRHLLCRFEPCVPRRSFSTK